MPTDTFFNLPEEKRRLILDLAIEEFATRDYRSASVSSIVTRAGIAKGSLYQYFDDKRELYLYLVELAWQEKKAFLAGATPPDPGMDVFDYLRWMIGEGARFELSNPLLAQVAYRALFTDRPFGDEPFARVRQAALDFYQGLVQMGIRQGRIDSALDEQLLVFLLSTLFNHFGQHALERQNIQPEALAHGKIHYQDVAFGALADQLISILQKGLAPASN